MRGYGLKAVLCLLVSWLCGCSAGKNPAAEVSEVEPSDARSEAEGLAKNALSAAQAKTALELIDEICGDTWCDGDYDFGFRRLICSQAAETCTLTLQVFPRAGVASRARSYWRSCKTADFFGFASLVSSGPNGYRALNGDYYDALSACLSRIVSNLS